MKYKILYIDYKIIIIINLLFLSCAFYDELKGDPTAFLVHFSYGSFLADRTATQYDRLLA